MKKEAKDWIINFDGMVKNRLGPYRVIAIQNNSGKYWTDSGVWLDNKAAARDYVDNFGPPFGTEYKTYLTTAAGDIELHKADCKN
jgi:hypothetical protein